MFAEIYFQQPSWLAVAPLALAVYLVFAWLRPRGIVSFAALWQQAARRVYRHPLLAVPASSRKAVAKPSWYARGMRWLAWPVFLTLVFLALADPVRQGERLPDPPEHRDIMFVVDTSISLVLKDYQVAGKAVSREKVLKDVLAGFVAGLRGNRLGLIAFSEQAYTWVPLTTDHALLLYQLQRLQPASLTGRGSRLGEALLYLGKRYAPTGRRKARPPVFVLLTDAHRPGREVDPRIAAAWLAQQGLVLHTIALGAGEHAAIEGGPGELIYQPMNIQLLEETARAAGGRFFWARDFAALDSALAVIRNSARSEEVPAPEYVILPLYQWVLALLLVWLAAWQFLPALLLQDPDGGG